MPQRPLSIKPAARPYSPFQCVLNFSLLDIPIDTIHPCAFTVSESCHAEDVPHAHCVPVQLPEDDAFHGAHCGKELQELDMSGDGSMLSMGAVGCQVSQVSFKRLQACC